MYVPSLKMPHETLMSAWPFWAQPEMNLAQGVWPLHNTGDSVILSVPVRWAMPHDHADPFLLLSVLFAVLDLGGEAVRRVHPAGVALPGRARGRPAARLPLHRSLLQSVRPLPALAKLHASIITSFGLLRL